MTGREVNRTFAGALAFGTGTVGAAATGASGVCGLARGERFSG